MGYLKIILIDCGNGDSVFIEHLAEDGFKHYALVDANDYKYLAPTLTFLTRHFQKIGTERGEDDVIFDYVFLSHAHADHVRGLKKIMAKFGTWRFSYPKSLNWSSHSALLDYADKSDNIRVHHALDQNSFIDDFGDVQIDVLWPPDDDDQMQGREENNNSVVLLLTYAGQSIILPGDAEREVWQGAIQYVPPGTMIFKVPHHGSENGTFDDQDEPAWLGRCHDDAHLPISCHPPAYGHPHKMVTDLFENEGVSWYRTDEHYHVLFTMDDLGNLTIRHTR